MIQWPERAKSALAYLFWPLQEVDIYVEDTGDAAFYSVLFRRIVNERIKIARVFEAGNRSKVLEAARKHDFAARRAFFLVDGDYEWVRGEAAPAIRGVYRLDAYCIENLLLSESAAAQVLMDGEAILELDARRMLQFPRWLASVEVLLVDLFVAFSLLNEVNATIRTVASGVHGILTQAAARRSPVLDAAKVRRWHADVLRDAALVVGQAAVDARYREIQERVASLPRRVDVVSGKDFLFPLFEFHLRSFTKQVPDRKSLRFRLARQCDTQRFGDVFTALERAARGQV